MAASESTWLTIYLKKKLVLVHKGEWKLSEQVCAMWPTV